MEIRKPEVSELETILHLTPQAMSEGTLGEVQPTGEETEQLVALILDKGGFYFAAAEDGIKGWILLGTSKDRLTGQRVGFIYELFVLEAFRGQGIGEELMAAGISHFKGEGLTKVRLSVKAGNTAIRLYEKMGFLPNTVTMKMDL
ncbi:GNAT family N-acetyltransferase [Planococcus lenghuensis]|uniref:GNAT family N-acetyltransferase n=1 Tax=Planococcus lenghuensis TaxID=2213202 RepID=A0A1Q2KY96_9BACL|nr:GNAT family N-acetyltransferase [Planococcus lenghuensis]AQQ52767.1 GNAT family N-acetyltransferase [Planococcus lenghuensis]